MVTDVNKASVLKSLTASMTWIVIQMNVARMVFVHGQDVEQIQIVNQTLNVTKENVSLETAQDLNIVLLEMNVGLVKNV